GQVNQLQLFGAAAGPCAEGSRPLPLHAREQGKQLASGAALQAIEEALQMRCAQAAVIGQPEHLAAVAHGSQYTMSPFLPRLRCTDVVDPENVAAFRPGLAGDLMIGTLVPALDTDRRVGDALGRAFGIQPPALQVVCRSAVGQGDLVLLVDQCPHGVELPEQVGQLVRLRCAGDQCLVYLQLLLGAQHPSLAGLAAALADGYRVPAAVLPSLVRGNDGRWGQPSGGADGLQCIARQAQLHGLDTQAVQ